MAMSPLILARPDAACGKVFHANRRSAEQQRIALEIWNRANGCVKENRRLVVFHCKRCGGFHIGQKRIDRLRPRTDSRTRTNEIDLETLHFKHQQAKKRSRPTEDEASSMEPRREPGEPNPNCTDNIDKTDNTGGE
jgi:hypothetical protein